MAARIEDYALIGDCTTGALVAHDGSIDWLCWPRFDSGACFAALLGTEENGRWSLGPAEPGRTTRRYRPGTLILETRHETATGIVEVIDFMPMQNTWSSLIRLVRGVAGTVRMRTNLRMRFDYGMTVPWVSRVDATTLCAIAGPDRIAIRSPVALQGEDMQTVGEFEVAAGDTVPFSAQYSLSYLNEPEAHDPEALLHETERYWTDWSARAKVEGPHAELVRRSLLVLKALTYRWTGGIVAAVTTSLPEKLGGGRNWDYRYCWLRDATLTLLAFMRAGYYEEADAWRNWLLRAVAGSPDQFQIMYGLAGERRLPEFELAWLDGYENSKPVRVGNAAAEQLQLDVFGELIDAMAQSDEGGLAPSPRGLAMQRGALEHLERIWREPDEGIWEIRGEPRHFTHSKAMAWVAFHRAAEAAKGTENAQYAEHWAAVAATIHDEVCREGYDAERGSFVQYYGGKPVDAALLMLPLVGFLPPDDPRIQGTVATIERELMSHGLVLRYPTDKGVDGMPPGEGAFLACSFWLADNYILAGRMEEAHALFDRLAGFANDLGLLSEEYDPVTGRLLGNFPQAFSHVALVNTALSLERETTLRRDGCRP